VPQMVVAIFWVIEDCHCERSKAICAGLTRDHTGKPLDCLVVSLLAMTLVV
jgi:hypothetical protein